MTGTNDFKSLNNSKTSNLKTPNKSKTNTPISSPSKNKNNNKDLLKGKTSAIKSNSSNKKIILFKRASTTIIKSDKAVPFNKSSKSIIKSVKQKLSSSSKLDDTLTPSSTSKNLIFYPALNDNITTNYNDLSRKESAVNLNLNLYDVNSKQTKTIENNDKNKTTFKRSITANPIIKKDTSKSNLYVNNNNNGKKNIEGLKLNKASSSSSFKVINKKANVLKI